MKNEIKSCINIFFVCICLMMLLILMTACGSSGGGGQAVTERHPIEKTWALSVDEFCYISYGFGEGGTATLLAYCNDFGNHFNLQAYRGTYEILSADRLQVTWERASCAGTSFSSQYTFLVNGNQLTLRRDGSSTINVFVDSQTVPQYEGNAMITTGCFDDNDNFTEMPVADLG